MNRHDEHIHLRAPFFDLGRHRLAIYLSPHTVQSDNAKLEAADLGHRRRKPVHPSNFGGVQVLGRLDDARVAVIADVVVLQRHDIYTRGFQRRGEAGPPAQHKARFVARTVLNERRFEVDYGKIARRENVLGGRHREIEIVFPIANHRVRAARRNDIAGDDEDA